jgi:hypothetical protein
MNGPQHYAAAQQRLKEATDVPVGEYATLALASAQVHATLALAAATIDMTNVSVTVAANLDEWIGVTK